MTIIKKFTYFIISTKQFWILTADQKFTFKMLHINQ